MRLLAFSGSSCSLLLFVSTSSTVFGKAQLPQIAGVSNGTHPQVPLPGALAKAAWKDIADENAAHHRDDPRKADTPLRVDRIRETVYVYENSNAAACTPTPEPTLGRPRTLPTGPPADISKTIKTLRPIFDFAIHHPLRALYRYIIPYTAHYVWTSIKWSSKSAWSLANFIFYHMAPLLVPFRFTAHLASIPLKTARDVSNALSPLYYFIASALCAGALLGSIAGLATGRSVQTWLESVTYSKTARLREIGDTRATRDLDLDDSFSKSQRSRVDKGKGVDRRKEQIDELWRGQPPWSPSEQPSDASAGMEADDDTSTEETDSTILRPSMRGGRGVLSASSSSGISERERRNRLSQVRRL